MGNATTKRNPQKAPHSHTPGQSEAAKAARLDRGACPIHGIGMSQIGSWFIDQEGRDVTIVACPRKDCDEVWTATNRDQIVQRLDNSVTLTPPDIWYEVEVKRLRARVAELEAQLREA